MILSSHPKQTLIDIVWLTALACYMLTGISILPFQPDEATLVYMSKDFYYHFVEKDNSKIFYEKQEK